MLTCSLHDFYRRKIFVVEVVSVLHTIVVHDVVRWWLVGIPPADVADVPQRQI